MPGLFGSVSFNGLKMREVSCEQLYTTNFSCLTQWKYKNHIGGALSNSSSKKFTIINEILMAFDGYLTRPDSTLTDIFDFIYEQYLKIGPEFVKEFNGSFQILIIDGRGPEQKIYLYADHTASMQTFYVLTQDALWFSPDIEALIPVLVKKRLDSMASIHFLACGHFPSGHTAIKEVKVLKPGEYIAIVDGVAKKRNYYRFQVKPDDRLDKYQAMEELDRLLTRAVHRNWGRAEDSAILLSGGYDSQFIFYTIAESVEDTRKLVTVTWGQEPKKCNSDMEIARRTASRFGTRHIEIEKSCDRIPIEYEEMFRAQSGLTDSSFYHANELFVCRNLRENYGIKSVMRGEECMGYGPPVYTLQNALSVNGLSLPAYISNIADWFSYGDAFVMQYTQFMRNLVDKYDCKSFNDLKDTIDFNERQHMNRNPLNYFKMHYLDVYCPLLDVEVLNLVCKLPAPLRHHKILFKHLLKKKFGRNLRIADFNNLADWKTIIGQSEQISGFLMKEIEKLPPIFDPYFFKNLISYSKKPVRKDLKSSIRRHLKPLKRVLPIEAVQQFINHRKRYEEPEFRIPPHFLAIRAAVLARWNKSFLLV